MAGDVTTSVTAVISVVDKATPAIDGITKSLGQVEQVAKQVGEAMPKNIDAILKRVEEGSRSLAEQRRQMEAAGGFKPPEWAKIHAPDIAPAVAAQVEQVKAAVAEVERPLTSLGDRVRSQLSRAFAGVSESATTVRAHVQRIGVALDAVGGIGASVATKLQSIFGGLGGFLAKFGAGFGIASLIGVAFKGLDELVAKATKLGETARTIGVPVERLQELQRWAKDSSLSVEVLDRNLGRLTRTLGQVAAGENKKAAELFKDLNIAVTDAAGKPRQTADVWRDLSAAFPKMANRGETPRPGFIPCRPSGQGR